MLVHLPIALIVLLALLEVLARFDRFSHANRNVGLILAVAVPAAIFTVLFGWLLSLGGGYQDGLLQWHKWTGIATSAICLVAGVLYSLNWKRLYRWSLFASTMLLLVASHYGGSLTHGSDYLARYAPGPLRRMLGFQGEPANSDKKPGDSTDPRVYVAVIRPILEQNCTQCHGPEKSKAGLRLDTFERMLRGGESGPAIVPGKSLESSLVKRMRLPASSEDHMPPEGKPQPTAGDVALLQWWIDSSAATNQTGAQLKPPPAISRILEARSATTLPAPKLLAPKPLQEISPQVEALAQKLNLLIEPIAPGEPWLRCSASLLGTNFGDTELTALAPLAPNLRSLDLGGTGVSDAGLVGLPGMLNLTRLHLERTRISDAGIASLGGLVNLEYLNLYGTEVTDASLPTLQGLAKLKQVYLWQTKVTPDAARAFADAKIDKDEIRRLEQELEQTRARLRQAQFLVVDTGAVTEKARATNAVQTNALCPVSGKAVDATKTLIHEGRVVAFCCDDCKAQFQKDPKPFLAKLESATLKPEDTEAKK
jgi:hypothetical protein